jgi:hypothetical protein
MGVGGSGGDGDGEGERHDAPRERTSPPSPPHSQIAGPGRAGRSAPKVFDPLVRRPVLLVKRHVLTSCWSNDIF